MSAITIGLLIGFMSLVARPLFAQPAQSPPQTAAQSSATIPPGTVITTANWTQYKQFFSDGEIYLWQGTDFWKMPPDVRIEVGPTTVYPLPAPFVEATEKYGGQTRLEKQSDGRWKLLDYVAGVPFPTPEEPNKGLKILVNVNYRILPHLIAGFSDSGTPMSACNVDRFSNVICFRLDYDIRQMAYNWEPGVQREEPEQYRYATNLIVLWQDGFRPEESYVYIPVLRRMMRQSDASHCASAQPFGDLTWDDLNTGWNGGTADFNADFVKRMKLLALTQMNSDDGAFPQNYDMPLGWAKPSWGRWELRDVWVINVRPIPMIAPRYCYGQRVMYADASTYAPLAEELYDARMQLEKISILSQTPAVVPGYGMQTWGGGLLHQLWSLEGQHAAFIFTADQQDRNWTIYSAVKPQYDDIRRYQSPGGVMSLAR
jgi:hypothetical protein